MSRPHIEWIQAQVLPWEKDLHEDGRPGVERKILSRDDETGASTLIIRYPAGWQFAEPCYLLSDEQMLVLSGELEINGTVYGPDCFAHLPKGYARFNASSSKGADVLTFLSGKFDLVKGSPPDGQFDLSSSIPYLDTGELAWDKGEAGHEKIDPNYSWLDMRVKELYYDGSTRTRISLLMTSAQNHPPEWRQQQEWHECYEECLMISGDFISNTGTWYGGAYFFRPPGILHGPFATRYGNLSVIRTIGLHENNWTGAEFELSMTPKHRPTLPRYLHQFAARPWVPSDRY